jgi:hypothetical protein
MEDSFLSNLQNGNYTAPPTDKELKQQEKNDKKISANHVKFQKSFEKMTKREAKVEDDGPVGPDRIRLLIRINKYKELFPEETKHFQIKKNASKEELEEGIKELEILSESGGVDAFFNDMILECIKGAEQLSTYSSNYNISGLSVLLKTNKKFNTLCKQLQLKYNLFVNVPIEIQLILIVSTTSVLCMNKNKNKNEINSYLDEPYHANPTETNILV